MIAVLGAGLAGLTAAYELIKKGVPGKDIIIFEKEDEVGGLAQTKSYNGFRFDLGPHRWFTKSKELDHLWTEINSPDILELERLTRIWYKKKLFNYPLSPMNALKNLGVVESTGALLTYFLQTFKNRFNKMPPHNMEEAFIRQFGPTLYKAFFKDYNQKLWGGYGCKDLSPDWVRQRVKNLSLSQALLDAIGFSKKGSIVSLVDRFKYPKNGTGQLSQNMARFVISAGATILCSSEVKRIEKVGKRLSRISVNNNGCDWEYEIDYCISSIPIDLLSSAIDEGIPSEVAEAIKGLRYRHLIFIVLFIDMPRVMKDNWLYVQDPSVSFNRFMDMGSWNSSLSPEGLTSIVFEVTCDSGDEAWNRPDGNWISRISEEFVSEFNFIKKENIIGGKVFRKTHAYPVYALDYRKRLDVVKYELKKIENLQLIGRNGLFSYNNMDHSMVSGRAAARNYSGENIDIDNINMEQDYHEEIRNT